MRSRLFIVPGNAPGTVADSVVERGYARLCLLYYALRNTPAVIAWRMAIQSFTCRHTQALYEGSNPRVFRAVIAVATRKLQMLDVAASLEFLRSPPGNRLEVLRGDRAGQHSIRINDQFRLCFRWTDAGPNDVEIVDYH